MFYNTTKLIELYSFFVPLPWWLCTINFTPIQQNMYICMYMCCCCCCCCCCYCYEVTELYCATSCSKKKVKFFWNVKKLSISFAHRFIYFAIFLNMNKILWDYICFFLFTFHCWILFILCCLCFEIKR